MNKNFFKIIFITLILLLSAAGSASAGFPWNLFGTDDSEISEKLKEIDLKTEVIAKNKEFMKFLNNNMFDQDVDTIEISIKNEDQILKTYYIVRGKNKKAPCTISKKVPDNKGITWKFIPTVDQALDGLDQAEEGIIIHDQYDRSTASKLAVISSMLKAGYLYIRVEKVDVPAGEDIIESSDCRRCKKALNWCGCSFLFN